jgi:tetratricopeptide (TPR) repeat protein
VALSKDRVFQLTTIVGAPLVALLAAELILSLAGYGSTAEEEDPFLGFTSVSPLFEVERSAGPAHTAVYATRPSKLAWFNHQEFELEKPNNGYRIFSFGGSTTFGRPYEHDTSYSNWLEILLRAANPSTFYEVVNVGGVSYASYRIINLMREMLSYEPDLFIVYTGHNEFLEERTYSDILEEAPSLTRLRTVLHRSRSYSLARSLWLGVQDRGREEADRRFQMSGEVTAILDQTFGLEQYRRDAEKREAIEAHFRFNLDKMVDMAEDHGVRLIFVVPASNERDFSPFKSQHCRALTGPRRAVWYQFYDEGLSRSEHGDLGVALEAFRRAADLDSCHADLRYRMGQAYFGLGQYDEAKSEFRQALDLDVAPLRATPTIQETVREVATRRDVPLIDLVALLESEVRAASPHDVLGREAFLDHVHPRIEVHQRLAEELAETLFRVGWVEPATPLRELDRTALYDGVISTLDSSYYATRDLNLAKVLSWLGKDQEAAPFVTRAAKAMPDHPEAQYLRGVFLQQEGRYEEAERAYVSAIALDSTFSRAHGALGSIYERTGRVDEAIASMRLAVRYDPESDNAHYSLGNALRGGRLVDEAIAAYEQALRLNPRNSQALNNLAAVHITMGNYEVAIESLGRVLELDPDNVNAYRNLGLSQYQSGRYGEARRMFERLLEIQPGDNFATLWLQRLDAEGRQ